MKNTQKNTNLKIILSIIVLFFLFLNREREELYLSTPKWECSKKICCVGFKLINNTDKYLYRNISIRAHSHRSVGNGGMVTNIIGEKIINASLSPHEQKEFSEFLKLKRKKRVDMIALNTYLPVKK